MFESLHASIVAVVRATRAEVPNELLGTGIVVSPTAVVTCRHVVEELADGPERSPAVLRGSVMRRATRVHPSNHLDLCCLRFRSLPGAIPAPFTRLLRLADLKLAALGFSQCDPTAPRGVPELNAIQEEQYGGWLESAQFGSGLPDGFSGAPVLGEIDGAWRAIGMLRLGGETASTSRMIAADPIAAFLAEMSIQTDIMDASEMPPSGLRTPGKINIVVGRDIAQSVLQARGSMIEMKVRRDLRDSDIELIGGSPPPD